VTTCTTKSRTLSLLGLGALVAAGLALAAPAAHAGVQFSPGPPVTGVAGPIKNGSVGDLVSTSNSALTLFVGASAADTDTLSLFGTTLFNNKVDPSGFTQSIVTSPGEVLPFTLNNLTTGKSFVVGTGYTNTDAGAFSPVYHFAAFSFTSEADYNSLFGVGGVPMSAAANAVILANGGYSAWIFAGAEDLTNAASQDWNNVIYAYHQVGMIPEPVSLALLGAGMFSLGVVRRRRRS